MLPSNSSLTAGVGYFAVTLGTVGSKTVTASDTVTSSIAITGTTDPIAVSVGPVQHFNVSAGSSVTAGGAVSFIVTALDQFGNTVTGYTGTVHFTTSDPSGTPSSDSTLTASGKGTFSVTLQTAGIQTVTATDTTTSSVTGTSGPITVTAGTANHLVVIPSTNNTTAGVAFNFTVMAQDQYNNSATSYGGSVHFSSSDGNPLTTLPANIALTGGLGTFSAALTTVGNQTLSAVDMSNGSIHGTSGSIAVSAAAAERLAVSAPPTASAGGIFLFTVTAQDHFSNTVKAFGDIVHFGSNDLSAILPGNTTLVNGTGTFSATLKLAGSDTLTATDTATSAVAAGSATIAVSALAATHFVVTAPVPATAGAAFTVGVVAKDQFGNTDLGYGGTVHFGTSDSQAVAGVDLPINSTLTNGSGLFAVILKTAGNQTVTATDVANSGINGTSGSIAVAADVLNHFAVSTPSTASAGVAISFTVTAQDKYNNAVTAYGGTVHLTSSDGTATLTPVNSTLTSGVGTFSATLKLAGSRTVTATDGGITGTSNPIVVSPGVATHFGVAVPATATAGIAFNFAVSALDANGNVATSYAGTVHLTSTDPTGTLAADNTLTGGLGTFSATLRAAGNRTVSASDTVITGISGNVAVGAAAVSHLAFVVVPPTATAGSQFGFTVTAEDQFNNTVAGYADSVHFSSSDAAAVFVPVNSTLAANGSGSFFATLKTAGSRTLTATDLANSAINGTSSAIAVSADVASYFTVTAPASTIAGNPFVSTVTAFDQNNNIATGYSGIIHFTSTDGQAGLPANTTLSSGVGVFAVVLKTVKAAGNQTITVTDSVTSTINGTSATVAVSAAAAQHFALTVPPGATTGHIINFTVTAEDLYNNTATTYGGSVHFSSSDGAASLPTNHALTAGIGTFSATLKTTGSQTLSATDTVTTSITGTSGAIAVRGLMVTSFAPTPLAAPTGFVVAVQQAFRSQHAQSL